MISTLNLLWIIPLSVFLGFLIAALIVAGEALEMITEEEMEMFIDGIIDPVYDPSPAFYEDKTNERINNIPAPESGRPLASRSMCSHGEHVPGISHAAEQCGKPMHAKG